MRWSPGRLRLMVCGAKVTDAESEKRLAAIEYARGSIAHLAPDRNLADELIADRRGKQSAADAGLPGAEQCGLA